MSETDWLDLHKCMFTLMMIYSSTVELKEYLYRILPKKKYLKSLCILTNKRSISTEFTRTGFNRLIGYDLVQSRDH